MRAGEYYSKGKFLLSGEYLVLHGAKALSVPLKFGQSMTVSKISSPGIILWETLVKDKPWFRAEFQGKEMKIISTTSDHSAILIRKLLKAGCDLQPGLFPGGAGFRIQCRIDFDLAWGLGSSSSLVSNLAEWLDIDLFTYYRKVFQGSGFDVFCARADQPVIYSVEDDHPKVEQASLHPDVTKYLYFVYLGQKQDSQESVRKFREKGPSDPQVIREISGLTVAMSREADPVRFFELMEQHERIISGILGITPVKQEMFPDFQGEIKSLGAWGGDFIMAGSFLSQDAVRDYFKKKKLDVIFSWTEIIYKC